LSSGADEEAQLSRNRANGAKVKEPVHKTAAIGSAPSASASAKATVANKEKRFADRKSLMFFPIAFSSQWKAGVTSRAQKAADCGSS